MALDRLVSVQDYADFARVFAGIGKADARLITDGSRKLLHLTIAGAGDIPIDGTSELFQNLEGALAKYGDPYQPIIVAVRERIAIMISAKVKLMPDRSWDATEPKIREALGQAFGFDQRELGQRVYKTEVISAIKSVPGVDYVEIDLFKGLTQKELLELVETSDGPPGGTGVDPEVGKGTEVIAVDPAGFDPDDKDFVNGIQPAQIAYLLPDVPDTLILNEVKD